MAENDWNCITQKNLKWIKNLESIIDKNLTILIKKLSQIESGTLENPPIMVFKKLININK